MRAFAFLVAPALLFAAAPRAEAFCRTTTEPVPANYNPIQSGCLGGTPLAWPSMPVAYQVFQGASSQVPLAEATSIIDASFGTWQAASCSTTDPTAHPSLSVTDLGATDVPDPLVSCDATPCQLSRNATHGIYFRDDAWPYTDSTNEIALTTVTYGVDDGHIFAAVMELNSHDHPFSTSPADSSGLSLQAVVTHEAGHFLGMAHSPDTGAVMYAFYRGNAIDLTEDDTTGICDAYPPAQSPGCSCDVVHAGSSPWGLGLALGTLLIAGSRRQRRRPVRR